MFDELSLSAQTNFAELAEQARARRAERSVADLTGSFNCKQIKGNRYWYWQFRDLEGKLGQIYLGPDNERLRQLVRVRAEGRTQRQDGVARLAHACGSLGCAGIASQHFKVIHRLAEHGYFRAGGVLMGTHAFIAMGNMLGVHWSDRRKTHDIGSADAGKNISLALPTHAATDVHDAITSLELGLLPGNSFAVGQGATYFYTKRGDLRIDVLTVAGRSDRIHRHDRLNVNLQPLKFMELSLEKTTQTVVISGENALVVNIPSPMRYALHKLIVMAEREVQLQTKIAKDAEQVASLVSYGFERIPYALQEAVEDLIRRGKGWRTRTVVGLKILADYHPEIAQQLKDVLRHPSALRLGR